MCFVCIECVFCACRPCVLFVPTVCLVHGVMDKRRKVCVDGSCTFLFQPVYGMSVRDHIPFRFASGGGRELYFVGEKDLDLQEVIASRLPSVPPDITLKCISDGVLPALTFSNLSLFLISHCNWYCFVCFSEVEIPFHVFLDGVVGIWYFSVFRYQ